MCSCFTEKVVFKPNDVSVFSTLSINGRLFVCRRDELDSLVRNRTGRILEFVVIQPIRLDSDIEGIFFFLLFLAQSPLPEQVEPSAGLSSNFELMSSKDVACHMTSYDWELFYCVHEVGPMIISRQDLFKYDT